MHRLQDRICTSALKQVNALVHKLLHLIDVGFLQVETTFPVWVMYVSVLLFGYTGGVHG